MTRRPSYCIDLKHLATAAEMLEFHSHRTSNLEACKSMDRAAEWLTQWVDYLTQQRKIAEIATQKQISKSAARKMLIQEEVNEFLSGLANWNADRL